MKTFLCCHRERDGMSPILDNESSKSHRDSFEIDLDSCAEGNKVDHYSEEGMVSHIHFEVFMKNFANSGTDSEHTGWYS
jgi:hypothetical protein